MEKKTIIKEFINYFERLLGEKDIEKQKEIAKEIDNFSAKINDEIEEKYWDKFLESIQKAGLELDHWKDETGYCGITEDDIRNFIKKLKEMLNK